MIISTIIDNGRGVTHQTMYLYLGNKELDIPGHQFECIHSRR